MKTTKKFKIGDQVKVSKPYSNASEFSLKVEGSAINGIYGQENWADKVFFVMGKYKLCKFDHNPNIFGAYPVGDGEKILGYVYNDALDTWHHHLADFEKMRSALEQIEQWKTPETGKFWDAEKTQPTSYEVEYGSNGVRDYFRSLAKNALTPSGEK